MNATLATMAPSPGVATPMANAGGAALGAAPIGSDAAVAETPTAFAAMLATAGQTLLAQTVPDSMATPVEPEVSSVTTAAEAAAHGAFPQDLRQDLPRDFPQAFPQAVAQAVPQTSQLDEPETITAPLPLLELSTSAPLHTHGARNGSLGAAAQALPHDALQHLQQAMAQAAAMLAVLPPNTDAAEAAEAHLNGVPLAARTLAALEAGAADEASNDASMAPAVPMPLVPAWLPPATTPGLGAANASTELPAAEADTRSAFGTHASAITASTTGGSTPGHEAEFDRSAGHITAGAANVQAQAHEAEAADREGVAPSGLAHKTSRKSAGNDESAASATTTSTAVASASVMAHNAHAPLGTSHGVSAEASDPASAMGAEASAVNTAEPPTPHTTAPQTSASRSEHAAGPSFAQQLRHAFEAQLSAPINSPQFGSALGLQISTLLRNGVPEARLQLNPAELGPVAVQIALTGNAALVNLAADHALTRQALEQAMPQLASALQDAGFTLAGGGVSQQPNFAHAQQQAQQQAQQGTHRTSTQPSTGELGGMASNADGQPRRSAIRNSSGLVDFYA